MWNLIKHFCFKSNKNLSRQTCLIIKWLTLRLWMGHTMTSTSLDTRWWYKQGGAYDLPGTTYHGYTTKIVTILFHLGFSKVFLKPVIRYYSVSIHPSIFASFDAYLWLRYWIDTSLGHDVVVKFSRFYNEGACQLDCTYSSTSYHYFVSNRNFNSESFLKWPGIESCSYFYKTITGILSSASTSVQGRSIFKFSSHWQMLWQ